MEAILMSVAGSAASIIAGADYGDEQFSQEWHDHRRIAPHDELSLLMQVKLAQRVDTLVMPE
jgi:hypothetical protein